MKKCLLLLPVIFFVVGCSGTTSDQPKVVGTVAPPTSTSQKEFKVGDVIELTGHKIIINSANKKYKSSSEYIEPPQGKKWVVVSVTIENTSATDLKIDPWFFKLREDSTKIKYDYTGIGYLETPLQSVSLGAGGKITGNIPFEVNANETDYTLECLYNFDFGDSTTLSIKI